jgi:hypothetical protein
LLFEFKGLNGLGHPGGKTAGELDLKDDLIGEIGLPVASVESDIRCLSHTDRQIAIEGYTHIVLSDTFIGLPEISYPRHRLGTNFRKIKLKLLQCRMFTLILHVGSVWQKTSFYQGWKILLHDSGSTLNDHIIHPAFDFGKSRRYRVISITANTQFESVLKAVCGFVKKLQIV